MIKIICVCGARPNFMKIAPVMRAFEVHGNFHTLLVHTGQHYDENMSRLFFDELEIPKPDINLEVGSGSHAYQTAEIMKRLSYVIIATIGNLLKSQENRQKRLFQMPNLLLKKHKRR